MRTRRFANSEKIRSKDRRLHQVLKRRDFALLLKAMPKGVLDAVSHTTAGTASTIHTPVRALVVTAEETWQVDFADTPDPTGGYDDVVIPAAKQIGELADDAVVSFVGQSVGTYIVYAQHDLEDENPEQRDPPGKFAGGTGSFTEHATFFGHGNADGTPIPREGYDNTLSPEIISEAVDRLTIGFASEGAVPTNATPLVSVVWNGTSVVSSQVVARVLDLTTLYDHISAGGSSHAVATTSTAGFMSAADKTKLDNATSNNAANTIAMRDGSGRIAVGTPNSGGMAANRDYVDGKVAAIPNATPSAAGLMSGADKTKLDNLRGLLGNASQVYAGRVNANGTTASGFPPGWSVNKSITGIYEIIHGLSLSFYFVTTHTHNSGLGAYASVTTKQTDRFYVNTRIDNQTYTDLGFDFILVVVE